MAERKSKIARVTQYFRDADADEMRVVFTIVREIVEARLHTGAKIAPKPAVRRTRKVKSLSMSTTIGEVMDGKAKGAAVGGSVGTGAGESLADA